MNRNDSDFEEWLGVYQDGVAPSRTRQQRPAGGDILTRLRTPPSANLVKPRTPAPISSAPNPQPQRELEMSKMDQMSIKDRIVAQPEIKWALIIMAVTLVAVVACLIYVMINQKRQNARDKARHKIVLDSLEKQPMTQGQMRALLSPTGASALVSNTPEHVMSSFPKDMQDTLSIAVQGTGKELIDDFEQATDPSAEIPTQVRHAMLLSCQSRLAILNTLAVPALVKELNGFDVIDMKLRINSAIQDLYA